LQTAKQHLQQLQDANAKLETELHDEKEKSRQLSCAVGTWSPRASAARPRVGPPQAEHSFTITTVSQLDGSGSNVDAMAEASAFILQLQQELDGSRQKLEEQARNGTPNL
jgi:hypothetical protein